MSTKIVPLMERLSIYRDGDLVAEVRGEAELMRWFHEEHSFSMHHAVTYEGYSVKDSRGLDVLV